MELLNWDGTMSVGIDIFDEEHEKLTSYINQLHEALSNGSDRDVIQKLFEELIDYAVQHFNREESLFKDTEYPENKQKIHSDEHEALKTKLLGIHKRFVAGESSVISHELMEFLINWLVHHTHDIDMGYVPYVKKKLGRR